MAKLILFSQPTDAVLDKLATELFIEPTMGIAYMPSDGSHPDNQKYEQFWSEYIKSHRGEIIPIDNSLRGKAVETEVAKLLAADALILTGGNTFQFLSHLRQSGLDKAVRKFAEQSKPIAGFSAGAIILTPTIEIASLPGLDDNTVGLKDFTGLGLVDFEIFPHYVANLHSMLVDNYEKKSGRQVKRLTDEDLLIID